ncbi:hypothetical protein NDU88_010645 [Pleurodeles waltl]|uniref:Uncharacterized protein n=1 Tax=Pleurodeles waltl TaxID=8319 RepID=A0AAV7S3V4_PLEWA|nr:hypothetical protein NDU88_010645 [Pleurodeles waltl]
MAAPIEFQQQPAFSVDKRSVSNPRCDASVLSFDEEVVVISDDEEEVQVSQVSLLSKEKRDDSDLSGRKGGTCIQLIPRVVSPMLHRVQSWGISNQANLQLGEQIELVDQDGNVFKGTVCGERCSSGAIDRAYVSLDLSKMVVGPSGCDTSHVSGEHGLQAIHQRSGRIVGEQSLPVKVRAPSLHRLEGRVKPGAVYPTSGETFGVNESEPSTSRGAGGGLASMEEELLDYDEEFEETVSSRHRVCRSGEVSGEVQGSLSKAHVQDITVGSFPRVVALSVWGRFLANRNVIFNVDNQTVVHLVNSQKAKDEKARHVPGINNDIADALSRFQWQRFRGLAQGADIQKTAIPGELCEQSFNVFYLYWFIFPGKKGNKGTSVFDD